VSVILGQPQVDRPGAVLLAEHLDLVLDDARIDHDVRRGLAVDGLGTDDHELVGVPREALVPDGSNGLAGQVRRFL
jgi:hypothetical protein